MRYSFEMALAYMKQGQPMRRAYWPPWMYYKLSDGVLLLCRDGEGSTVLGAPNISLGGVSAEEVLADDWEKYE